MKAPATGDRKSSAAPSRPFFQARRNGSESQLPDSKAEYDRQAESDTAEAVEVQRTPAFETGDDSSDTGTQLRRKPAFDSDEQSVQSKRIQRHSRRGGHFFNAPNAGGQRPSTPFFAPVQAALTVGRPDDHYEREADQMADQIVYGSGKTGTASSPTQPSDDGQTAQRKPLFESVTPLVQASSESTPSVDSDTADRIESSAGGGRPLDEPVKSQMESGFGTDFSDVNVHTDSEAADLNRSLDAQAFTHGNDVYFNEGKYRPDTSEGQHLIAHELTHTLQQSRGAQRQISRVEKLPPSLTGGFEAKKGPFARSRIDPKAKKLELPRISLADFKGRRHSGKFQLPIILNKEKREGTKQQPNWRNDVRASTADQLTKLAKGARDRGGENQAGQVFFQGTKRRDLIIFGTEKELKPHFEIPYWDKKNRGRKFHVDHIKAVQISGPDNISNYELLDASANMSEGGKLAAEIRRRIRGALQAIRDENPGNNNIPRPSRWKYVKKNYHVSFTSRDFKLKKFKGKPHENYWLADEIKDGEHSKLLKPMRKKDLEKLGKKGRLMFFASETGGTKMPMPKSEPQQNWLPRVDYLGWDPIDGSPKHGDLAGTLRVNVFKSKTAKKRKAGVQIESDYEGLPPWEVKHIDGIHGGVIDKASVAKGVKQSLSLPGMSPILLDTVDLGPAGIQGEGRVLPTLPLIKDADIRIRIAGGEVQLRKTFSSGDVKVPAPFEITDSTLTVFWGTRSGLGAEGQVDFGIQKVGKGFVAGAVSRNGELELKGGFDFDSKLFKPARIEVGYKDKKFSAKGELGIPKGKVRGINGAKITVDYNEDRGISAEGNAKLDVPGVKEGTLKAMYDNKTGAFSVGGKFHLRDDIPGIKSGTVEATVSKDPAKEGYKVYVKGEAQPAIPGLNTSLSIEYDNGALTIAGRTAYKRGMLEGKVNIGATNRALGTDGQPTGKPTDTFIVYGGGELSLTLTPWLKATAGVQFLPNGEIQVKGEIGLPSEAQVFGRIGIPENEIFKLGFDIPIFAIPVGPKSIGLKATIRGGIRAHAGIGPGKLTDTKLSIIYNPDRESETVLMGGAKFVVPADAGLKFFVSATIGLDALIGGVEGGLEVSAGVGLKAEASAAVLVAWSPTSGLELRANLAAHIQPKFTFDITGIIKAWFAWYDKKWRWKLKSYEYGPDMRFGMKLPIVYKEGKPFNVAFDDIKFEKPKIGSQFLKGLIKDVRNNRA